MKTIGEILDHKFVGNHFSDAAAFDAIDDFVECKANSITDRAAAIRHMYVVGMGLKGEEACSQMSDEGIVSNHIEQRGDFDDIPY